MGRSVVLRSKVVLATAACIAVTSGCGPKPETTLPASELAQQGATQAPSTGVLLEQAGELAASDPALDQRFMDEYEVQVAAGVRVQVRVDATGVDTTLVVTAPDGSEHANDDYNGSTQVSFVEFVNPTAGVMKVRVSSYAANATGQYRLHVEALPDAPQSGGTMLAVGIQAQGALDAADTASREGVHSETFAIEGGQPRTVALTLRANGFAADMSVLTPDGQSIGGQTDAQGVTTATFSIAAPGTYRIAVAERQAGRGGAFTLAATEAQGNAISATQNTNTNTNTSTPRNHHVGNVQATAALSGTVSGELRRGDSAFQSGELVDAYTFDVRQPTQVQIDFESEAFDPYLLVVSPSGRVIEDDDGGDVGYNSRISETLNETGTYTVYASQYQQGATGAYRIVVGAPQAPVTNPVTNPVVTPVASADVQRDGALAQGDSDLQGRFADSYDFQWTSGQRIQLALESSAFDTVLAVRTPSGRVMQNDDADPSQNTNSALAVDVNESGRYSVIVTSYAAGNTGAYSLRVRGGGGSTPNTPNTPNNPPQNPVASNDINGALEASDQAVEGRHRDQHVLQLPAGRVRVSVSSSQFDTTMLIEGPDGSRIDNDDIAQDNTNSQIDLTVPTAGNYRLFVSSYAPGATGQYRVSVGPVGATPNTPNNPTNPTQPEQLSGALAASDTAFGGGRYSDVYTRTWQAGGSRSVAVASTEFDTYVIVRAPSGRTFDNDDVAQGNTNSLISFPVTESGQWQILVTSYGAGMTGAYTVGISEGGGTGTGEQPPHTGGGPRVFGIFAGISDYGGHGDLPECANDAIKLAEDLRTAGVMTQERQIVLTDGQVTPQGISQAFQQMGRTVQQNDVFLFFYSGHGGQTNSSNDRNELDSRDEYIYVRNGQVNDDEMNRLFDGIHAQTAIIALDSCFSGGFAKDVISRPGRMGFFSSEEDLTSAVAGAFQAGGYLSYFLRTGMRGDADAAPRDGRLTAGELQHYLTNEFGEHVRDVESSTMDNTGGFQHLVVDRGAVRVDTMLLSY